MIDAVQNTWEVLKKLVRLLLPQAFVDNSFEAAASTDAALGLLRQFRQVLLREGLRATLDAKHAAVFQRFAADVEEVRARYERQKRRPPLQRNAPRVAGHIRWARQLLRRIEGPMNECACCHGSVHPVHACSLLCGIRCS